MQMVFKKLKVLALFDIVVKAKLKYNKNFDIYFQDKEIKIHS